VRESVRDKPGVMWLLLLAMVPSIGLNDNQGNMTVTAPGFVNAGTTEDVIVNWSGLESNTIYLGGISHHAPQGLVGITVINIRN